MEALNIEKLNAEGLKATQQRLKILDFLEKRRIHPTAAEVYLSLKDELPTLSLATVYNTLNSLADAGLLKTLTIEGVEIRYEIDPRPHGHFKCVKCGKIYDFETEENVKGLEGFKIDTRDVFYKGVCKNCL
jgi:Fe2+/Zn2+ uptake regulation proteins